MSRSQVLFTVSYIHRIHRMSSFTRITHYSLLIMFINLSNYALYTSCGYSFSYRNINT